MISMENVANDYLAGTAAGIAMVITGHPFDTVKVKLQSQTTSTHAVKYRGAIQCAAHILRDEGVRGWYRGATSSFVAVALESSLLFGAYSQMKMSLQGADVNTPKLVAVIPSAAFAGATVSVILSPAELVKCRLQVRTGLPNVHLSDYQRYSGPLDCIQKTIKHEGVQGMFRGWTATMFREAIGNAVFFTTYELMKSSIFTALNLNKSKVSIANDGLNPEGEFQASKKEGNPVTQALSEAAVGVATGGIAGIAFWTVTLPLDVAKTQIQTTINLKESRSILHHLALIYKKHGVKGLYAGLGPTLIRAFPANAAAIVAWELCAKFLGIVHPKEA